MSLDPRLLHIKELQVTDPDGDDKVEQADADTHPPHDATYRHRHEDRRG